MVVPSGSVVPVLSPSLSLSPSLAPTAAVTPAAPTVAPALEAVATPLASPAPVALEAVPGQAPGGESDRAGGEQAWARFMGEAGRPLNILLAGAESVPYIKTGGLADVMDALHRGFAARGHKTLLILPKYPQLDAEKLKLERVPGEFSVPVAGRQEPVTLWKGENGGAPVYFIDNPNVYSRDGPYHSMKPGYNDTDERFIFFSRAVLETAKRLGFKPDIIHAHDWHVGLVPALLKTVYAADPFFAGTAAVQTIHNIAYQGAFELESLAKAGLDPADFHAETFKLWGKFNMLKSGLATADAVTTVSPNYAREIRASDEFGRGLQGLLTERAKDLFGIINGLDGDLWNPATDKALPVNYTPDGVARGKAADKAALQQEARLTIDPNRPLFGVAARLDTQKGLDLVAEIAPLLVQMGAQLVLAGSGDPMIQQRFEALQKVFPGYVFLHPFSESFARKVFAASDFLLMPSRFEPCGLSQLIAHRYGAVPIATRTGGLADTIKDGREHPGLGDGLFLDGFSIEAMTNAVLRALALYADKAALSAVRQNGMAKDNSWEPSLDAYIALFRYVLSRRVP